MELRKKTSSKKAAITAPVSNKPVSHGVGRRKAAVARVWLRKGEGRITVNGKDFTSYFTTDLMKLQAAAAFHALPSAAHFDVEANIVGGGLAGQAGALKLGIARALLGHDESVRSVLREHNLLTVDDRVKERKKYGQKAARRKFQFVKR